jgi:hypothetical protein
MFSKYNVWNGPEEKNDGKERQSKEVSEGTSGAPNPRSKNGT